VHFLEPRATDFASRYEAIECEVALLHPLREECVPVLVRFVPGILRDSGRTHKQNIHRMQVSEDNGMLLELATGTKQV
jgi:hypothetical protein